MSGIADPYKVKVTNGVLITCDSAAKQILLHVDAARDGPSKFILQDGANLEEIKDLLQEELEKNTYVQDPNL